jgi:hypothetical protein
MSVALFGYIYRRVRSSSTVDFLGLVPNKGVHTEFAFSA